MSSMNAVQEIELEAALQRVGRGEASAQDAHFLRLVFQQMEKRIRQLQAALDAEERIYEGSDG